MDETIHISVGNETAQPEPPPVERAERRKSGSQKKRRISVVIAFIALIIVVVATIVGSNLWRNTLKVKRVFVEGAHIVTAAEIVQLTRVKAGIPLYQIDLEMVRGDILTEHYIKTVDVWRGLPDALHIVVQEREPIAAVSAKGQMMFFDTAGMVLAPLEGKLFDVPFITGYADSTTLSFGTLVEEKNVLQALDLLNQAREIDQTGAEIYQLISEVNIQPNGDFVLYSSDAGVKILLGKHDEIKKLLMLKTFWSQFVHQHGAEHLRLVDLRYEGQVVARWSDHGNKR